jgi:poly(3-hydroxybutyrate) depolymerase
MLKRITLFLFVVALTINAQTAINLHGKVLNLTNKPIAGAIVTIVKQGLKDTTGSDGAYLILNQTAVVPPVALIPQRQTIVLENGFLEFSLPDISPVKVQIFDVRGKLLKNEFLPNASRGFYRFSIEENARASKVLIIKTSIDKDEFTFRYLPLHGGKYIMNQSQKNPATAGSKLAKLTAVSDTLKITATGYLTKTIAIASYDQELNINLDTAGNKGVRPSSGCGKAATFKGETQVTIAVKTGTSSDNRMYYLRIPDDYDQNTPYALWFTPHCLNGSAENVAHSEPDTRARYEYLGMWRCANPAGGKGTTIFCAPQGLNAGWGSGQKDLEFFRAMIKKFESELCIDESRIFSSGFSMGGSMSYALACAMPDTMRAIAMHSGGSMSGCDGSHRGPVPIFITHGTDDGTCRWPGSGMPQINDLAQRDGCKTEDLATLCKPVDRMHPVCVEYQNCNPGFPCRACIFKGEHIGSPGTQGSWGKNDTWVPDSTWSYFKRFY